MQCSRLQSKLQSNEPQLALVSCAERKKVAKFVVIVSSMDLQKEPTQMDNAHNTM